MKATINGITYEGTEEEIMRVADRMTIKVEGNPYMPRKQGMIDMRSEEFKDLCSEIMSGGYTCRNTI